MKAPISKDVLRRPWRVVVQSHSVDDSPGDSPELAEASEAFQAVALDREVAELRAWRSRSRTEAPDWREAAGTVQSLLWLTPAELGELRAELEALALRFAERYEDAGARPPGAALVRFMAWVYPAFPGEAEPID